jgi:hypothetical protein
MFYSTFLYNFYSFIKTNQFCKNGGNWGGREFAALKNSQFYDYPYISHETENQLPKYSIQNMTLVNIFVWKLSIAKILVLLLAYKAAHGALSGKQP